MTCALKTIEDNPKASEKQEADKLCVSTILSRRLDVQLANILCQSMSSKRCRFAGEFTKEIYKVSGEYETVHV